jgi:hypothetical protein
MQIVTASDLYEKAKKRRVRRYFYQFYTVFWKVREFYSLNSRCGISIDLLTLVSKLTTKIKSIKRVI